MRHGRPRSTFLAIAVLVAVVGVTLVLGLFVVGMLGGTPFDDDAVLQEEAR